MRDLAPGKMSRRNWWETDLAEFDSLKFSGLDLIFEEKKTDFPGQKLKEQI